MAKNLARKGIIRAGLILIFFAMGFYFQKIGPDDKDFYSMIASTIIAASIAGFSVIYDYDKWPVRKKIFIHSICMALTIIPALIISGWFDLSSPLGYVKMLSFFVMFGIAFASIGYLISKFILKNVPEK